MKQGLFIYIYMLCLSIVCTSCHRASESESDDTDSSFVDGDSDADSDSDSDTDTDTDTDSGADQNLLNIRIDNQTGQNIFIGQDDEVMLQKEVNGRWQSIGFQTPYCMLSCEGLTDTDECCLPCPQPMNETLYIPPGDNYEFQWDALLYRTNEELCSCGCYESYQPAAGHYRFSTCAYSDILSFNGSLTLPDTTAWISEAEPAFVSFRCYYVEFDIPTTDERLDLIITSVENTCTTDADCPATEYCQNCVYAPCPECSACFSGCVSHNCVTESIPTCNMIRPECDTGTAIIQNGCWECSCE